MDVPARLAAIARRIEEIVQKAAGWDVAAIPRAPDNGETEAMRFGAVLSERLGVASAPRAISSLIAHAAVTWRVDPALVTAIVANESGFDAGATSPAGAQGLMQLEPATAAALGVRDPYDPRENIAGGTRYIRGLLERFHGDVRLAVAAYNAGPAAVERYNGVPPYAETQTYVARVLSSYAAYRGRSLP